YSSSNAPAPTEIYTLSLHDALPISIERLGRGRVQGHAGLPRGRSWRRHSNDHGHGDADAARLCARLGRTDAGGAVRSRPPCAPRSEEHTSELQSRENLVCRLLLEKK